VRGCFRGSRHTSLLWPHRPASQQLLARPGSQARSCCSPSRSACSALRARRHAHKSAVQRRTNAGIALPLLASSLNRRQDNTTALAGTFRVIVGPVIRVELLPDKRAVGSIIAVVLVRFWSRCLWGRAVRQRKWLPLPWRRPSLPLLRVSSRSSPWRSGTKEQWHRTGVRRWSWGRQPWRRLYRHPPRPSAT
jgi:hypothetical protein